MQAPSRSVTSNQRHPHRRLPALVHKHLNSSYARPVAAHSEKAFREVLTALESKRPLVLDSFCGTGHSTTELARRHRGHLVIGVDKSADRLSRHCGTPDDNYLLLQADCEDIWQLLLQHGVTLEHHYLLYPNPWPKSRHLGRRVHGSGAFSRLLQLGGRVEVRSNWQLYIEEFGLAMQLAGHPGVVSLLPEQSPLTLFEGKYRASGHPLWRFVGDTRPAEVP